MTEQPNPTATKWRHASRGTTYEVVGEGRFQADSGRYDDGTVVIYRGDDGVWVRPWVEFMDGRFERLE
jgi:hypothetical protein